MLTLALLAITAAVVAALYVRTASVPSARHDSPEPAAVVETSEPIVPRPVAPSRSRGRDDWLFFFNPGDWLVRMSDDALLGVVVGLEKTHGFADGTRGPAYVVESMEGEQRALDADELERTARLR